MNKNSSQPEVQLYRVTGQGWTYNVKVNGRCVAFARGLTKSAALAAAAEAANANR